MIAAGQVCPDLSAILKCGRIQHSALIAAGGTCRTEIIPGEYVRISAQGDHGFLVTAEGQEGKLSEVTEHEAMSHMLPALLKLAADIRWSEESVPENEEQDLSWRLRFIRTSLAAICTTFTDGRKLGHPAIPEGELAFLSALVQASGSILRSTCGNMEYLNGIAAYMRSGMAPWHLYRPAGNHGLPRNMLPVELDRMGRFALSGDIMREPGKARFLLGMVAFAGLDAEGTLDGYVSCISLLRQREAVWTHPREIRVFSERGWGKDDWWTLLNSEDIREIGRFTSRQVRNLLERGPGCASSPASLALLIRLIASGQLGPITYDELRAAPQFCSDPGLTIWVFTSLTGVAGGVRARQLVREAARYSAEEGQGITAAAWANLIDDFDTVSEMPISWWASLGA